MMTIIAIGRSLPFCAYRPTWVGVRSRAFLGRPEHRVEVHRDRLASLPGQGRSLVDLADGRREVSDYLVDPPGALRVLEVPAASDGAIEAVAQDLVLCFGSAQPIGLRTSVRPWLPLLGTGPSPGCNEAADAADRADNLGRDPVPTGLAVESVTVDPSKALTSFGTDGHRASCAPDVDWSCTDGASSRGDSAGRRLQLRLPLDFASSSLPPCFACSLVAVLP